MHVWQKTIFEQFRASISKRLNRAKCFSVMGGIGCAILATAGSTAFAKLWVDRPFVLSPSKSYRFENRPQERTQPIIVGDIVYYATLSGEVRAIHRLGGYLLWKKKLPAGVEGALLYGRSKIFVGDRQGNLFALNARDGSQAWHFKIKAEWLSRPAIQRTRLFIASSDNALYALDEAKGTQLWYYPNKGDEKMTVRGTAPTVVFGGEVYQGFSSGSLVSLSTTNGREVWRKRLRQKERFYDVDSQAYVDDSRVITSSFDGSLYSLDRLSGSVKWVFRVGSYGGFLVRNNRLYFAGLNGYFYCLDVGTGSVIWKTSYGKGVGLTPTWVRQYILFTTSSDPMFLLDPSNGKVVWQTNLGAGSLASPVADPDGRFFCLSNYGNLYAFQLQGEIPESVKDTILRTPSAIHHHANELGKRS